MHVAEVKADKFLQVFYISKRTQIEDYKRKFEQVRVLSLKLCNFTITLNKHDPVEPPTRTLLLRFGTGAFRF